MEKLTYEKLMSSGFIFVGYDYCNVYDALDLLRCYNCNKYGHSSKACKNKICCPRCSGEHSVKECKSTELKCSNCVSTEKQGNSSIDVNHAVWDSSCIFYNNLLTKLRADLKMA